MERQKWSGIVTKTQLLSLNISLTVFIMIWQVLARKKDGEEVRVPATTLSEARGAACCFIRDGLDVVKIESASGFIIEPHGPFAIASRAGLTFPRKSGHRVMRISPLPVQ